MGGIMIFFIDDLYGDYTVESFKLNDDGSTYSLTLKNTKYSCECPYCKQQVNKIHSKNTRMVIDTFQYKVFNVSFTSRKFKCQLCNKIFTEKIPFIMGKSKYTTRVIGAIFYSYNKYKNNENTKRFMELHCIIPDLNIPINELNSIIRRAKQNSSYPVYDYIVEYDENEYWQHVSHLYDDDWIYFLDASPLQDEIEYIQKCIQEGKAINILHYSNRVKSCKFASNRVKMV